jgi:DNA-binding IclR family transcriptional regulator
VISERGWAAEIANRVPGVAPIAVPIAPSDATEAGSIGIEGSIDSVFDDHTPRSDLLSATIESVRMVSRIRSRERTLSA